MKQPTDPDDFDRWLVHMHRQLDRMFVIMVPVLLFVIGVELHYQNYILAVFVAFAFGVATGTTLFRFAKKKWDNIE